jgi:wobble nucleotide-excising tRNase
MAIEMSNCEAACESLFCPFCGDELAQPSEIKAQEAYFREHGVCSHWDEHNQLDEF